MNYLAIKPTLAKARPGKSTKVPNLQTVEPLQASICSRGALLTCRDRHVRPPCHATQGVLSSTWISLRRHIGNVHGGS